MALLRGTDGQEFELVLDSYQYPGHSRDEWDANWLNVTVRVDAGNRKWRKTDPALLTWEVCTLITWLETVARDHGQADSTVVFTEPCLVFELLDQQRLLVELDLELSFTGSRSLNRETDRIEFPLDELDLASFARDLKSEMKKFPIRVLEKKGAAVAHRNWHGCAV